MIFYVCWLLHFHQLPNTRWCHLTKDKTRYSVITNNWKVTFLNLSCFFYQSKCYKKIDLINNIVWFWDLFDLSVVFMQDAFEIWRYHSLVLHARETFCQTLVQFADQIANKYNVCCYSSRSWTTYLPRFSNTLLQSVLFSNFKLCWTHLSIR